MRRVFRKAAGLLLVVMMFGAVQAQAATPVGTDCFGDRCLLGLSYAKQHVSRGMLRVDAYARSGASAPSMQRVNSQRDRSGTAWVYSTRRGWRAVKIRDMRVRVLPTRWQGWTKVKRLRDGARWMYVSDSDYGIEVAAMRCGGAGIMPVTDKIVDCSDSDRICMDRSHDDERDSEFGKLAHAAVCDYSTQLPVMSRDQLMAGEGLIAGTAELRTGSTWTEQRFNLQVDPAAGHEVDEAAADQHLICTLSLRSAVLSSDGQRYTFSRIDSTSTGAPIMVSHIGSRDQIVLTNPTPTEPVAGHKMFIVTCGVSSDINLVDVRATDPIVMRPFGSL